MSILHPNQDLQKWGSKHSLQQKDSIKQRQKRRKKLKEYIVGVKKKKIKGP